MKRGASLALLLVVVFVSSACYRRRDPVIYVLDHETKGWVVIVYNHSGAQPLPRKGDAYLITVPRTGAVGTSTKLESGRATDRFLVRGPGEKEEALPTTRLHANQVGWRRIGEGKPIEYEVFFVGSKEELRAAEPSEVAVERAYKSLTSKK